MAGAIRMIHVYRAKTPSPFEFLLVNSNTGSIVPLNMQASFWVSKVIGNADESPGMLSEYIGTYEEFVTLYP